MLYSIIEHRFRLHSRIRLLWQSCWDETSDSMLLRSPENLKRLLQSKQDTSEIGSVSMIVTPNTAATSSLHVSVLTLPPGTEMASQYAPAVELYYVLSGTGLFSQQGVFETASISKDDAFVVDPNAIRWLSNSKGIEELVLLRVTDGGAQYNGTGANAIRYDPNRKPSALEQLSSGIRQVHKMAKDIVSVSSKA
jgi:mannose-6-phosphate isomerase-like protein (cupin superfamily)